MQPATGAIHRDHEAGMECDARPRGVNVFPRLFIGMVVLICTEVFSGASVAVGLWQPWTWVVTYWLYFAHFFLFTTLAVRTRRTGIWSLYLWGVLFGLYESWITKVIWHGYSGDGEFVMGSLGPYGLSELSMVFIFHPVAAFILPLAVSCVLCPPLRRLFPDLAWLASRTRGARALRMYLIASFAVVLGMNSGGPVHLVLNLLFALAVLWVVARLARPRLARWGGEDIVVIRRWGLAVLCAYLSALYGLTYVYLQPDGLPSIPIQLWTFAAYAVLVAGLRLHRPRAPLPASAPAAANGERRTIVVGFSTILGLALALSPFAGRAATYLPVALNFVVWIPLGFGLTGWALVRGRRDVQPTTATCE